MAESKGTNRNTSLEKRGPKRLNGGCSFDLSKLKNADEEELEEFLSRFSYEDE